MNAGQRQKADDLWTKPSDLSQRPTYRQLGSHIHHRHSQMSQEQLASVCNFFDFFVEQGSVKDSKDCRSERDRMIRVWAASFVAACLLTGFISV